MSNVCSECGGPVFAEVMRGGVAVALCQTCFDAHPAPTLPANLVAAGESRIDEGTPLTLEKTYMPTRAQFERIYRAARDVVAEHQTELPAGYTLVRSTLLRDLRQSLDAVNVDV